MQCSQSVYIFTVNFLVSNARSSNFKQFQREKRKKLVEIHFASSLQAFIFS